MATGNVKRIDALTQFVGGTEAIWNSVTQPIPDGMVVIAMDNGVVKIGDGNTLFVNLPTQFTVSEITSLNTRVQSLEGNTNTLQSDLDTFRTTIQEQIAAINPEVRVEDIVGLEDYVAGEMMRQDALTTITGAVGYQMYSNGSITAATFTPEFRNGNHQVVNFDIVNVTLNAPSFASPNGELTNATSGILNLYVTTAKTGTIITLGSNMRYIGDAGLMVLSGQTMLIQVHRVGTQFLVSTQVSMVGA